MHRDAIATPFLPCSGCAPVEWTTAPRPIEYPDAVALMEARVDAILEGRAAERVWLIEHPPIYTAGTSARQEDLLAARFPVFRTGRGGQYTYHGPGQRIAYVMLDLRRRQPDVRVFVAALESWVIATLARFDVRAERREERVGVWVGRPDKLPGFDGTPAEDKIAAIGIRLRRWISFHGIAVNIDPDLSHFGGIVPCGVAQSHLGVTSLKDLGHGTTMRDFDRELRSCFEKAFGATSPLDPQPGSDS